MVWVSYPDLVQTVEADPRARPAFGFDVDSPGATQNCALLVRGALAFRSFRHLHTAKRKPGVHVKLLMGSLYTPAGLNLFVKLCPRVWTS